MTYTDFCNAAYNPGYVDEGSGSPTHTNTCNDWTNASECPTITNYHVNNDCDHKVNFSNWHDIHGNTSPVWDDYPHTHETRYWPNYPFNDIFWDNYPHNHNTHPECTHSEASWVDRDAPFSQTGVCGHCNYSFTPAHDDCHYKYTPPHPNNYPWAQTETPIYPFTNTPYDWNDYPHTQETRHVNHDAAPHQHTGHINFCDHSNVYSGGCT